LSELRPPGRSEPGTVIARLAVFRDWTWRVAAFSVLAAVGALAAIAVSDGASGKPAPTTTTTPATQPTTTVAPPPTTTAPPTTTVAPPTTTPTTTPSGLIRWPSHDGYTVVLQSLPSSAQTSAEATARRAVASGLPEVGVLDSSAYSSLHAGYLVVFSGVYASSSEAGTAAGRAHSAGFPSAYSRQISR
jgi:hypothetical protein